MPNSEGSRCVGPVMFDVFLSFEGVKREEGESRDCGC